MKIPPLPKGVTALRALTAVAAFTPEDLRGFLVLSGLSKADMARTAGMSEAHLSRLASGKRTMTVAAFAKLYPHYPTLFKDTL